jgi:hypothetical protein
VSMVEAKTDGGWDTLLGAVASQGNTQTVSSSVSIRSVQDVFLSGEKAGFYANKLYTL